MRHVSVGDDSGPDATTTYTYDTDGEQTAVTSPDGNLSGANVANFTTTNTYNDDGELTASTQGGGSRGHGHGPDHRLRLRRRRQPDFGDRPPGL